MSHQAIHPDWDVMKELYDAKGGRSGVTENRIMRLAFHDCVKYTGENITDHISIHFNLTKTARADVTAVSTGRE